MQVHRNTRQRQMILEELRKLNTHPTAAELYDVVRRHLPNISLGTVYRNLELLTQMKLVKRLDTGGSEARFDGNLNPHFHVRCVQCGRVGDLNNVPDDLVKSGIEELNGYKILGYQPEFHGICPVCRKRPAPK